MTPRLPLMMTSVEPEACTGTKYGYSPIACTSRRRVNWRAFVNTSPACAIDCGVSAASAGRGRGKAAAGAAGWALDFTGLSVEWECWG